MAKRHQLYFMQYCKTNENILTNGKDKVVKNIGFKVFKNDTIAIIGFADFLTKLAEKKGVEITEINEHITKRSGFTIAATVGDERYVLSTKTLLQRVFGGGKNGKYFDDMERERVKRIYGVELVR